MSSVNEALIRDVVAEVMSRLGSPASRSTPAPAPAPAAPACGCGNKGAGSSSTGRRGNLGMFADASEACAAAHEGYLQLQKKGVAARRKVEEIIKTLSDANANEWGRIELEEIGRAHV